MSIDDLIPLKLTVLRKPFYNEWFYLKVLVASVFNYGQVAIWINRYRHTFFWFLLGWRPCQMMTNEHHARMIDRRLRVY